MAGASYDIEIDQGATFSRQVTIQDSNSVAIDITGSTFAGQIRKSASDGTVVATFTCAIVTAASGIMSFSLTAAQTAAITTIPSQAADRKPTVYAYDVEWTKADASVVRLLEGLCSVSPEVTRA
jgi:hypothetical protein